MKITMVSIGSTGDVLPYLVLGKELQARGHEITICAFSEFHEITIDAGLRFLPLYGNSKNFISELMNGGEGIGFLRRAAHILSEMAEPMMQSILSACEDADGIISVYLAEVVQTVAEVLHKPYIQTQFFPMEKTAQTAISSAPFRKLGKAWNLLTYDLGYLLIGGIEKYLLDDWRVAHGLPKKKLQTKRNYQVNGHYLPVIYAIPPQIFPRPKEWNEHVYMTGFWREDTSPQPDEGIVRFLEKGSKPIYIGFGSMNDDHMQKTLDVVLDALRRAHLRAVISSGWGDAVIQPTDDLYPLQYVSHTWLFNEVCATVHHGGAGTTAASLYAGKPMLIIPFSGDQPFWGERIHAMKLGPKPLNRNQVKSDVLAKTLLDLVNHSQYTENAVSMQKQLMETHPVQDAADIVERELAQWNSTQK